MSNLKQLLLWFGTIEIKLNWTDSGVWFNDKNFIFFLVIFFPRVAPNWAQSAH